MGTEMCLPFTYIPVTRYVSGSKLCIAEANFLPTKSSGTSEFLVILVTSALSYNLYRGIVTKGRLTKQLLAFSSALKLRTQEIIPETYCYLCATDGQL